jgi:hypothetical protein
MITYFQGCSWKKLIYSAVWYYVTKVYNKKNFLNVLYFFYKFFFMLPINIYVDADTFFKMSYICVFLVEIYSAVGQ